MKKLVSEFFINLILYQTLFIIALIGTNHLVSELVIMATNKEHIENLEAGLGSLQESFSRMELGMVDKLHHLEDAVGKICKALLVKNEPFSRTNSDQQGNSFNGRYREAKDKTRDNNDVTTRTYRSVIGTR